MRKKNLFFVFILFVFIGISSAIAQKADQVVVNIKFKPVQSIVVNSSQKHVDLVYRDKDNYANGVTSTQADHLEVFSTGGFAISVKTDGDFVRSNSGTIDANDVTVKAAFGSNTTIGTFTDAILSTTENTLITADKGGAALKYNITYDNTAGANNNYINKYIHSDSPASIYTTTVTYTIITN